MKKICIEMLSGRKMIAELYDESAPKTVEHFLSLVHENFFKNLIFHRIIDGFMVQGGAYYVDNTHTLQLKPCAKKVNGEFIENGVMNDIPHKLGTLSMARTDDVNSATSQFFICLDDCDFLNDKYAAFGRLIDVDSVGTLVKIAKMPTHALNDMFKDFPKVINEDIIISDVWEIE